MYDTCTAGRLLGSVWLGGLDGGGGGCGHGGSLGDVAVFLGWVGWGW